MPRQLEPTESSGQRDGLPTDVRVVGTELFLLPVETRVPLKFGLQTLTSVTCARVRLTVQDHTGNRAVGWGETPLNIQWAWPAKTSYARRYQAMIEMCRQLARAWAGFDEWGHPIEIGLAFLEDTLPVLRLTLKERLDVGESLPLLASLVCCSPFDLALHDAYGNLHNIPIYDTYNSEYMNRDLSAYLTPAEGADVEFRNKYPADYLSSVPKKSLTAWHLVGGLDPLDASEVNGSTVRDSHPALLSEWIERDGLTCLKVKLRGNDAEWDYHRLKKVASIAEQHSIQWLSADFNCTVLDPHYVYQVLDRFKEEHPRLSDSLLYVEQPFPYDLENHRIDVRGVSKRKPLFMDESAHDWQHVKLGHSFGWSGVALKTCKTQTGALLSLCWARAHGMQIMVQDLTNPMLAQVPHVLLAAYSDTIKGVETNAMQFYPDASLPEAQVHEGLYVRRNGQIDISTIRGPGFGYRIDEIDRELPQPELICGDVR